MSGALLPHAGTYAVRTPYDRALLPVLRALPGARWDAAAKVWTVSDAEADLPALLAAAAAHGWTVDPSIRARAEALAAAQDASASGADARASDPRLYAYQRAGVRWLARQDRALLADDMGLGKSSQALLALPDDAPLLVIAPASVKSVWRDEIATWRPDYTAEILDGRGSFRWPAPGEAVLTNYDIIPAADAEIPPPAPGTVLVVDECHFAKGRTTKRTAAVSRLARAVARCWGLSGTPLLNSPPELYQVFDTLDVAARVFGSFSGFWRAFQAKKVPRRAGNRLIRVTEWGQPRPEVPAMLARVMLRRERAAVLPDLPPERWQSVTVEGISKALRAQLTEAGRAWDEWVAEDPKGRRDELPPLDLFSAVWAALAAAKIPAMLRYVEEYERNDEPLVVFSMHRAPVDALAAREGWARISGDETAEQRADVVRRFQAGALRGVALTIQAGGTGITLTRSAFALFVDQAWVPALNQQAARRLSRIGQARPCLYTQLTTDHPVERRLRKVQRAKMRLEAATIAPAATTTAPAMLTESLQVTAAAADSGRRR